MRGVSNLLAITGLGLLLLNSLATVLDIVLRAVFSAPIERLSDISSVLYILSAAACLPAATVQRRHITIRAFESRLGPRGRAALEAWACAMLLLAWAVIAHQSWANAQEMRATGQTIPQFDIRVAPIWFVVAALMTFNLLAEVANLAHWLREWADGRGMTQPQAPEASGNIL